MTALEKEKRFSADEFFALSGLPERCELIDGYIYDMSPSPNIFHQKLISKLVTKFNNYIDKNKGKCTVIPSPSDVKINDFNVVQPDIYVVCDESKFDKNRCIGAPDWVIEIVSPSNTQHDTIDKLVLYREAGVREYWIVFPSEKQVLVYLFEAPNTTGIYSFDEEIPVGIWTGNDEPLKIKITDILS